MNSVCKLDCLVRTLPIALALVTHADAAQTPPFDLHVHLWHGEQSLATYEEQLEQAQIEVTGIGAMWFGGPNQALAGRPDRIQAGNDGIIALATKHSRLIPIATVHPYEVGLHSDLENRFTCEVRPAGLRLLMQHPHASFPSMRFCSAKRRVSSVQLICSI